VRESGLASGTAVSEVRSGASEVGGVADQSSLGMTGSHSPSVNAGSSPAWISDVLPTPSAPITSVIASR
jgi:hypothetical protein